MIIGVCPQVKLEGCLNTLSESCPKSCPTVHVGGCPMTVSESCSTIHLGGLSNVLCFQEQKPFVLKTVFLTLGLCMHEEVSEGSRYGEG